MRAAARRISARCSVACASCVTEGSGRDGDGNLQRELVHLELRGDVNRVRAREAGKAEAVAIGLSHRAAETCEAEIAKRIGTEHRADLALGMAGGDELTPRRYIDTHEAGPCDWRRRDAHVHLARPGASQLIDDASRRRAAHDGVVHEHDATTLED